MIIPKKEEIQKRREALGLTKAGLSRKAGLSTNALFRIESGESGYTHPIRAKAIAEALECQLEDVFSVQESRKVAVNEGKKFSFSKNQRTS